MGELKRIAIHSVPRSGSTWLGSIFDSSPNTAYRFQPLFSYGHKSQLKPNSATTEIDQFFNDILNTKDSFALQEEAIHKDLVPRFSKSAPTHLVYKEVRYHNILENLLAVDPDVKVIGLVRNPYSVINSWLKAPKEFRIDLGWEINEEWQFAQKKNLNRPEEFNGFNKWIEATLLFMRLQNEYPDRFFLLNYKNLQADTLNYVSQLFDFSEIELSKQTIDFINKSKSKNVSNAYGVFRKNHNENKWKAELPDYIIRAINSRLNGTDLEQFI